MLTGPLADNLIEAVASACRSGLDAEELRAAILPRLRKAVPTDALWWASADPATLLFTRSYREELPGRGACGWACYARPATWKTRRTALAWSSSRQTGQ